MLVDNVTITVTAGDGGNGAATLLRNAMTSKGGPDGGDGGNGGSVYFVGDANQNDLRYFRYKKKVTAERGGDGGSKNAFGRNAPHLEVPVPLGTRITDTKTGSVIEISKSGEPVMIARGGRGGRGNVAFKSATNRTPRFAEEGTPGESKELLLELRLIADIGLIGLPNAGKSSLLAVLTSAKPTIANYPFTTLEPNLGMYGKHAIADIPGLIEGASKGKGLGIQFLRHIEKTKILVHCIDASGSDPAGVYDLVRRELGQFSPLMLEKPEIVLITKTDLVGEPAAKRMLTAFRKKNPDTYGCSVYSEEALTRLRIILDKRLKTA